MFETKNGAVETRGDKRPSLVVTGMFPWPLSDKVFRALLSDTEMLGQVGWDELSKFSAQTRAWYFQKCRMHRTTPATDAVKAGLRDCNTVVRAVLQAISVHPRLCRLGMKDMDGDRVERLWKNCGQMDPFSALSLAQGCPAEWLPVLLHLASKSEVEIAVRAVEARLRGSTTASEPRNRKNQTTLRFFP